MGYVRDVYAKSLSSASDDVDPAFLDIVDGPALCFEGFENTEREREGSRTNMPKMPSTRPPKWSSPHRPEEVERLVNEEPRRGTASQFLLEIAA